MKAVVQRVTRASVTVGDREVGAIGRGLCILLGISRHDTRSEAEWMAKKLLNLRLFEDPANDKMWSKSVTDLGLEILCVSQGTKPDFHNAMGAETAGPMYHDFLQLLGSMYRPEAIKGGEFQAMMQVHIQNDGPVTLHLETPNLPPPKERKAPPGRRGSNDSRKSTQSENDGSGGAVAAISGLSIEEEQHDTS